MGENKVENIFFLYFYTGLNKWAYNNVWGVNNSQELFLDKYKNPFLILSTCVANHVYSCGERGCQVGWVNFLLGQEDWHARIFTRLP